MIKTLTMAAIALVAMTVSSANAGLLAYEGFDYADSNLNGQTGGSGWAAGGWTASDTVVNTDATLTYPALATTGSGARVNRTSRKATRTFASAQTSGVVWVSALFQPTWTFPVEGYNHEAYFRLVSGTSNVFYVGKFDNIDNYIVSSQANDTGVSALNNDLQFFVFRIDFGTGSDGTVHVFRNPTVSATAPALASAMWTLTGLTDTNMAFDGIQFDVPPGNSPPFEQKIRFDEIRLATDYANAVGIPEPATMVLLGLGSLMIARRSRRA